MFATHHTRYAHGGGNSHNVSWWKTPVSKKGPGPVWKIPEFPKGLATAFGPKLFKILKDWHLHNTCKQALAKDLNYEFSLYMGYPSGT